MLAAERGAAKNTLDAYRPRPRRLFLALSAGRGRDAADRDDPGHSRLSRGAGEGGAQAHVSARKLSAIRQFHRFLAAEERRADDPAVLLEGPRQGRRLPKILSVAEVDRLLARLPRGAGRSRASPGRAVARAPRRLSGRSALRLRPARLGTGGACRWSPRNRPKSAGTGRRLPHHQRQGRTRAAGAPDERGARGACGLPAAFCWSFIPSRRRRNGCSPRTARAAI